MMKHIVFPLFGLAIISFISACTITEKSNRAVKLSAQLGINHGGIIENTDLSVLDDGTVNAYTGATADAYTGATHMGFNAGIRASKPLGYGELGSGLDYMLSRQIFTYTDPFAEYSGERSLLTSQIMLPFTYNFNVLKKFLPRSDIQFKIGYLAQFNFVSAKNQGSLPEYSIMNYSGGPVFGFSFYPLQLSNGHKLGLYTEMYRGSQIYEDYYNQITFDMPGSAFFKAGIKYRFK